MLSMRTISATEASRKFSDLLDAIERGETVTVTRGNRPVAEIRPAHRRTGRDLRAALCEVPPPDDAFERDVADALTYVRASATSRSKASSGGGTSQSAARRSRPVRRWAGRISATGRFPRVTVTVSPRSMASRRSENFRDASVAEMVRMLSMLSDYQISDV